MALIPSQQMIVEGESVRALDRAALAHRQSLQGQMPAELAFGRLLAAVEAALPSQLPSAVESRTEMIFEELLGQALDPRGRANEDFPEALAEALGRAGCPISLYRHSDVETAAVALSAPGQAAAIGAVAGAVFGYFLAQGFAPRWELALMVLTSGLSALYAARKLPLSTRFVCGACRLPVARRAASCEGCGASLVSHSPQDSEAL